MKKLQVFLASMVLGFASFAIAQTCLPGQTTPASAPTADVINVSCTSGVNPDGGYVCRLSATSASAKGSVNTYPVGPLVTGALATAGNRAIATDNNWGDGGVP